MIERRHQSIKYEHLYLHEIDDGPALAEHVARHQRIYNDERPHETIDWARPRDRLHRDGHPTTNDCHTPERPDPSRARVNLGPASRLEPGVGAEAGRERGALRAQGEHALGELDRQVLTDAVGEQRELTVLKEKHLLARRRGGRGGRWAELGNDP